MDAWEYVQVTLSPTARSSGLPNLRMRPTVPSVVAFQVRVYVLPASRVAPKPGKMTGFSVESTARTAVAAMSMVETKARKRMMTDFVQLLEWVVGEQPE